MDCPHHNTDPYYSVMVCNTFWAFSHLFAYFFVSVGLSFNHFRMATLYYKTKSSSYSNLIRRLRKQLTFVSTSWQNQQSECAPSVRPVWSESSLCAQWVAKDPSFLHADSEDSDQIGRMPRLIWVLAGRTTTLLVLSWGGSFVSTVIFGLNLTSWCLFNFTLKLF